jgi:7-dehydrocholesterol reductase
VTSDTYAAGSPLRRTLPLLLLVLCPPTALVIWHTHVALDGSVTQLGLFFAQQGILSGLWTIIAPVAFGSPSAWAMIGIFAVIQLAFIRLLPGKRFEGLPTPSGHVPVYKANGPLAFALTLLLYWLFAFQLRLFSPTIIYDHFGELLGALNIFALLFCLMLYLKGRYKPSTSDAGISGNPIFDYYWGTELYPRILGFDLKLFTNCRFGMMGWGLLLISYAAKQHSLHGITWSMLVVVGLQLIYIAKFYWWETGYLRSMDIQHDRAGFYICWGCLVWLPCVYTSSTLFLVNHPTELHPVTALAILAAGTLAIFINYWADRQRQTVRALDGKCTVWGKDPTLIKAGYTTSDGQQRRNVLLASGWWGISRHFHYLPEILGAFFWTLPVLFTHALPWFYVVFLVILLTHRAFRDDERCRAKYGDDWARYCEKVPYKIIPGIL